MKRLSQLGESNGAAKLTEAIVSDMRARYRPRCRINGTAALAREFKVAYYAAWCAVHRQTWACVHE